MANCINVREYSYPRGLFRNHLHRQLINHQLTREIVERGYTDCLNFRSVRLSSSTRILLLKIAAKRGYLDTFQRIYVLTPVDLNILLYTVGNGDICLISSHLAILKHIIPPYLHLYEQVPLAIGGCRYPHVYRWMKQNLGYPTPMTSLVLCNCLWGVKRSITEFRPEDLYLASVNDRPQIFKYILEKLTFDTEELKKILIESMRRTKFDHKHAFYVKHIIRIDPYLL